MRTPPSQADRVLIETLAERGHHVTPTQLERWRHIGLISRAVVQRNTFAGSRVAAHDESVVESCEILAQVSTRGRPWQQSANALFNAECWLRDDALRETARYVVARALAPLVRVWSRCEVGARIPGTDPRGAVMEVARLAATMATRRLRHEVAPDVARAHPGSSREQLRKLTDRAIYWRLADIAVPELLGDEERNIARHGLPGPLDMLSGVICPLPSERKACIQTLTYAEANVARAALIADEAPGSNDDLLMPALWRVTCWRLHEHFARPDQPLPNEYLQGIRDRMLDDIHTDGTLPQAEVAADPPDRV